MSRKLAISAALAALTAAGTIVITAASAGQLGAFSPIIASTAVFALNALREWAKQNGYDVP